MSDPREQTQENSEVSDPSTHQDDLSDLLAEYPFGHIKRGAHEVHELQGVSMNRKDVVDLLDAYAALDIWFYVPNPHSDLKQLEVNFYLTDTNISATNTRHALVLVRHFLLCVATLPHLHTLVINTDVPESATQSPETELLQTRFIKEIMREVFAWFIGGGEKFRVILCTMGEMDVGGGFRHVLREADGEKAGMSVSPWEQKFGGMKRSGIVWRRVASSATSMPRRASV
ncbi:uncharacterized protein J4E79_008969 [Alternaria viburni]|uniref:uncharacterized protein n=1 Tax=Alternaria viburni TaxID=566460 RepID=UPI0020C49456|nr:uncharacterized protein J4E79_008969 [Alternaria viburni]KAI4652662.1 hypothetical protein J4E79_008969 [Alternaria viburni]